jgi:hypothetical protein
VENGSCFLAPELWLELRLSRERAQINEDGVTIAHFKRRILRPGLYFAAPQVIALLFSSTNRWRVKIKAVADPHV